MAAAAVLLALPAYAGGAFAKDLMSPTIGAIPDGSAPQPASKPLSEGEMKALADAPADLRFAVGFAAIDIPFGELSEVAFDRYGPRGMIYLALPDRFAARFFALTAGHVGQVMQVSIFGRVINAPKIMSAISGGRVQLLIDTYEEARIVADVLNRAAPCTALSGVTAQVE